MPNPKKIKSSDKRTVAIEKADEAGLKGEERDNYIKAMSPSQIQMKGSPYMMYGKETSPATMMGESPLAKMGGCKKMKKSK